MDQNNISDYQTRFEGVLQQDDNFTPAVLEITGVRDRRLSGSFVYGNSNLPLLDIKLSELPFPVIHTDNIRTHAQEIIEKQYPETGYNFPMIIDPEYQQRTNYELFRGVINYYDGDTYKVNNFTTDDESGESIPANYHVLTPFPYILEILRVGFNYAGLSFGGDFISDPNSRKLIWDTQKELEQLNSLIPSFHHVTTPESTEIINGYEESEYSVSVTMPYAIGHELRMFLKLPEHLEVLEYKVSFDDKTIYSSTLRKLDVKRSLSVSESQRGKDIIVTLKLRNTIADEAIGDISQFNFFNVWQDDGTLNVFPNSFTLSDVLPDMAFGTFLNKLKNWLNLDIKFRHDAVVMDYVEQKFIESSFIDESHLQAETFTKDFNNNIGYRLKFADKDLYVSNRGLVEDLTEYKSQNIRPIDLGVHMMNVQGKLDIRSARRIQNSDFQVLVYDGLQRSVFGFIEKFLPLAIQDVDGVAFYPEDIYERFWSHWLRFRTNSETIKERFDADIFEKLTTEQGKYKYNKKMLVKKITKRRKNENTWEVRTESETI